MKALVPRTRHEREQEEDQLLSPAATRSTAGRGRDEPEQPDPYRTAFERDRDRIIHSNAFRRLKHKTQVFINPDDDHFVTRLTHTLNVTQIGRSLARSLRLNEDLAEAICLGHDVGHPPFGHIGEVALSPYVDGEWLHSLQSLRIFKVLEPANLTWEVRDGIRAHTWRIDPAPVILTVNSDDALKNGATVWRFGKQLFLSDGLPLGSFSGPPLPRIRPEPKRTGMPPPPDTPKSPGSFLLDPSIDPVSKARAKRELRQHKNKWKRDRKRISRNRAKGWSED